MQTSKVSMVSQCQHCNAIKTEDGKGRTQYVPSIGEFPNLRKEPCYTCKVKHGDAKPVHVDIKKVDKVEMHAVTEKAVEQSYTNADSQWREMALQCVKTICEKHETFTVNEVRALVQMSPLKTHDNRAMGGVMATAKKLGWLAPTGESIPSVVGHKVHIQIWKSRIYKGA